jgi:hypothetical protein
MNDEMKAARDAWGSAVNWDHLDALTACEAWDAAEHAAAAALADLKAERDALKLRLAAAEDMNAACNADFSRIRAERDALLASECAALRTAGGE